MMSPLPSSAADSLAEADGAVLEGNDRAVWIGQGPLSNLAQLRACAPEITRRLDVTLMGGGLSELYRAPRAHHITHAWTPRAHAGSGPRRTWICPWSPPISPSPAKPRSPANSEVYQLLAADNAPKWARLVAAGYDRWFSRQAAGSKAADPLAVTAAAGLPFVSYETMRVAIGTDARMSLDPNGIALRMSTAADYPAFRSWTTMVVRHALESGMGYDPALIARRPGVPAALSHWS